MTLSLNLGLILHSSAIHCHRNFLLMILRSDYFPDLRAHYGLNLLGPRRVLKCSIYAFAIRNLAHIKRGVAANTRIETFVDRCYSLKYLNQTLLVIYCRFNVVVFQNFTDLSLLVKHKVARNNSTGEQFF